MAKKLHIQEPLGYDLAVWGLVSEERIWKLCHGLNQALRISLRARGDFGAPLSEEANTPESLGLLVDPGEAAEDPPSYEDLESSGSSEFFLIAADKPNLPADLKPFSYFFVIRYLKSGHPDLKSIEAKVHKLPMVRSLVDVTHIKHAKTILP